MAALPTNIDTALAEHAMAIRALGKRAAGDILEIGRRLIICKEKCGHGNWMPWVEREFGWSMSTANKYMNVARMFDHRLEGKLVGTTNLTIDIEALKTLAEPRTPEEARAEVIERAEQGEHLSVKEVQAIVDKSKPKPTSKPKPEPEIVTAPPTAPDQSEPEVAAPEVIEDNIMHAIGGMKENARVFNKLLKASVLDREAAIRINTAIDGMIGKWRSVQSTVASTIAGKTKVAPTETTVETTTTPAQETTDKSATTLKWSGMVPCGSSAGDDHSHHCASAPDGRVYMAMVVRKDGVFSHYGVSFVRPNKKNDKPDYVGSAKSLEKAKEIARQHADGKAKVSA